MVRFDDVRVDPWLRNQEEYKKIPEEAVFACAYFLFINPFDVAVSAFFRRTQKRDELWVGFWTPPMSGKYSVKKFSTSNKFDGFGCAVSAPIAGDKLQACKELLLHRYRSTVGFYWPTDFIKDGMLTESMYHEIIDTFKNELDKQAEIARESKSEIVTVARELGLGPEPTGTGPYSWRARCPKTSHPLYINTESNTFGCGWCKRKGGPGELQAFVKERRSKKS